MGCFLERRAGLPGPGGLMILRVGWGWEAVGGTGLFVVGREALVVGWGVLVVHACPQAGRGLVWGGLAVRWGLGVETG